MKFSGQNVLVTGATSGIGLEAADQFANLGANVVITGRSQEKLDNAKSNVNPSITGQICDVCDLSQVEEVFNLYEDATLDVLVVNAAVAKPLPFELITEDNFDLTIDTNLKGSFFTIQKALPKLTKNSKVVLITSISNQMGSPNFSAYAAAKAGLRSLVKTLGLELIGKGIRVNALSPGPIETKMYSDFDLGEEMVSEIKNMITAKSPIGRFGTVEETAKAILFLSSDESSYIVGDELVVDGGMSLL